MRGFARLWKRLPEGPTLLHAINKLSRYEPSPRQMISTYCAVLSFAFYYVVTLTSMPFHLQYVLRLSDQGRARLVKEIDGLQEEGIMPSIAGDIWGENGISIFGITVYFINKDFQLVERLVQAIPFGSQQHTGVNIERASKKALAEMHIGAFKEGEVAAQGQLAPVLEDTVSESIHTKVSDKGSNMVKGWDGFEGGVCAMHTGERSVDVFVKHAQVWRISVRISVLMFFLRGMLLCLYCAALFK